MYAEDSESFFNSEADYYNALVAAYDPLQSTFINVLMGEIASNNTSGWWRECNRCARISASR